ncbi:hypothetical protein PIB30_097586, partial [Stylosanthes scabra]|nr:hypothetical protein [Stylosanthes scabra]
SFNPRGIDTHFTMVLLDTIRYTCRDLGFTKCSIRPRLDVSQTWLIKACPSFPKLPQVTFGPRFKRGPNVTNRTLEHHQQQATFGPSLELGPNVALTQAQGLAPLRNL